jgi:hypothetical protein
VLEKVTAYSGSYQCVLDMSASESDGALIFDITGIAEDSREITVDKLNTRTVISSVAPKQRIIVMSIRITDTNVEERRATLMTVFRAGNSVKLVFKTSEVTYREISGVVESCNNPVFVKESIMVVTIICPKSEFLSSSKTLTNLIGGDTVGFTNDGDVSCGCNIALTLTGSPTTGTLTIKNNENNTSMKISMTKLAALLDPVPADSQILLKTGDIKSCELISQNTRHNIFSAVTLPYTWIQIDPGDNEIEATGVPNTGLAVTYQSNYGGL